MTHLEAHNWWATLASMWGCLWFGVLMAIAVPGPKAPGFLASAPVVVSSVTGAFFLVWLLRISYLAGRRQGGDES
ncbi:hypothetical protein CEP17_02815 [Microbacterium sp. PM5]|nr:hypothetical protein CEP17_02815 [Microbacterium sp. PM5]